jgi:urease accessory protein
VLRPAGDAVYLAQGAAGPLGGDRLELDVEVPPGRSLRLRAVAATLALPSLSGRPARVELLARVGEGASLEFLLEPVVVADRAWVELVTSLELAAGARLLWREEVVLGRYGERGGRVSTRVDAELDGRPLLRTGTDVSGCHAVTAAASVLGPHKAFGAVLAVGPEHGGRVRMPGRSAAELRPPGSGSLLTAAAGSAIELRHRLDDHLAVLRAREAAAPRAQPRRTASQSRKVLA